MKTTAKPKKWRCYARAPRIDHRERSWRIVLTSPSGVVTAKATDLEDETEAHELARAFERSYNEMGGPPGEPGADPGLTVGDLVTRNLQWRRAQGPDAEGCSPGSIEKLEQAQKDLASGLMRVQAARLTRADVVLARDALRVGPRGVRGASCVNGLLAFIASAWSWGLERGLVETPWPRLKRLKVRPTMKRPPTREEVAAVFDDLRSNAARRFWLPCFAAIYDSTARVSDVLRAKEKDLDRRTGKLSIWVKKGKHPLEVFLTSECLAILAPRGPDALLFPSRRDPSKRAVKNTIGNIMHRACARLGIKNVDVHSFRRKGVEDVCRTPGVAEKQAMKVTGHQDPDVFHGYQVRANDDMPAVWKAFHGARGPHPAAPPVHHAASQETATEAPVNPPGEPSVPTLGPYRESDAIPSLHAPADARGKAQA